MAAASAGLDRTAAPTLRVDGARLWGSLMAMAEIGATAKGGSCRLALSDEDREGRDLFRRWAEEAGCSIVIDSMGNIFARRAGRDASAAPVATGSHLDTQPTGGKFDGVYGVLAGLEVIRRLNELGIETDAPIEAIVWTNEEGARFAPSMIGSGVFAGVFDQAEAYATRDLDGKSLGEELARVGYRGEEPCGAHPIGAFFEAHIEQGPVLEAEGRTIGAVVGAQGMNWYDVELSGAEAHAGTTPMARRRDAYLAAARVADRLAAIAHAHGPHGVATVGQVQVFPNSRNTVPGRVAFSVDLRHPEADALAAMEAAMARALAEICDPVGIERRIERISAEAPIGFDPDCVEAVRAAAQALGFEPKEMVSGAGHDACFLASVAPTGMIFVPCADGISHNEVESATPEDLAAGASVLLNAMLERAGRAA
ncbi:MAG: Zn-dependent hydrolase [Marivibrio sp.]|uniref:Zn-dependent hydrolase n=1 Tax=Marivibrio sp. TaxID=2039719 RepID=UPI0032EC7A6D